MLTLKLTDSQVRILWNIVCKKYSYQDDSNSVDLFFLLSNGLAEGRHDHVRILPDGVIYLCIETYFIDITEWTNLVNNRPEDFISWSNHFRSKFRLTNYMNHLIKEDELYDEVCWLLARTKDANK
jgi:hypothetical protein